MVFAVHKNKLLLLNDFDRDMSEFSRMFSDSDCWSSHDFVTRWNILEKEFEKRDEKCLPDFPNLSPLQCTSTPVKELHSITNDDIWAESPNSDENSRSMKGKKRKMESNVSGRQRGLLAWERDFNKGLLEGNAEFGGEGWPPPFVPLVEEMRHFLFNETGLKENWDYEDASMLRKYFYLKYKIPAKNTSVLTLPAKVATMSVRCYRLTKEIIEMYQAGELERKRSSETSVSLAIHATYFDFLYNFNVIKQEEEVYNLLNKIRLEKRRPERRQNKKEIKDRRKQNHNEEELSRVKKTLELLKEELKTTRERNNELERTLARLNKDLSGKEKLQVSTYTQLQEIQLELHKTKEDNKHLANLLATNDKKLSNIKKEFFTLQKENERLRSDLKLNRLTPGSNSDSSDLEAAIGALRSSHKRKCGEIEEIRHQTTLEHDQPEKSDKENEEILECTNVMEKETQHNCDGQHADDDPSDVELIPSLEYNNLHIIHEEEEKNNNKADAVAVGDWSAADFGTDTFYVGKVTQVNPQLKTADAMFLKDTLTTNLERAQEKILESKTSRLTKLSRQIWM